MSWQASALVAEINENISIHEKLLLLVLANRHNPDEGAAYPSMARLARESLMSERQAYRVIDALVSKGLITKESGGGRGRRNRYLFVGLNTDRQSVFHRKLARENPDTTKRNPDRSPKANPDILVSAEPKEINREIKPKAASRARAEDLDLIAKEFGTYGHATASVPNAIGYSVEDFGLEWVRLAVRRGLSRRFERPPPWSWVESILEDWKQRGGPDDDKRTYSPPKSNGQIARPAPRHPRSGEFADISEDV